MKLLAIILVFLLTGCASTSKVEEVEQKILEGQNTITVLDEKINQLQEDKQALEKQLQFVDGANQSEAMGIRDKIASIDQSIGDYKSEISTINAYLSDNAAKISTVQNQQSKQKVALAAAIKKNEQLKLEAAQEIRELEKDYDERRKETEDPDAPKQED